MMSDKRLKEIEEFAKRVRAQVDFPIVDKLAQMLCEAVDEIKELREKIKPASRIVKCEFCGIAFKDQPGKIAEMSKAEHVANKHASISGC